MKKPTVMFDLHNGNKSKSNPHVLKTKFHELQARYSDYQHIYTDGSKDEEKFGCAFTTNNFSKTLRLPNGSSIFTAEIKAVELALEFIKTNPDNKFIIFSDSLSGLKALNHSYSRNAQIQNLLEKHHEISKSKEIIFCWLPSHIGIRGNEKADKKAKEALNLSVTNFTILFTNFKPYIHRYILSKWQSWWDNAVFNKLHKVRPLIKVDSPVVQSLKREDVALLAYE